MEPLRLVVTEKIKGCGACSHFLPYRDAEGAEVKNEAGQGEGECHRYPPESQVMKKTVRNPLTGQVTEMPMPFSYFRPVNTEMYCGEFIRS